jgi:exonuclease SbcC
VEAITSIQNDFQKIIVITHLDDLKDSFPARITVTKSEEGSRIEVA